MESSPNSLSVGTPTINHINEHGGEDTNGSRFRVDRVNSVAVGCHKESPAKEQPGILKGSELNTSCPATLNNLESIAENSSDQPRQLQVIKPKMPQRRVSIAEGVLSTGNRRKSSNLPGLDEFADGGPGGGGSLTVGVYGKSLYRYTQDALPKLENYRNLMSIQAQQRPTMDELMDETGGRFNSRRRQQSAGEAVVATGGIKFGWIEGCLVRCLLNIWGVMLFLRLSWMVAQAGIVQSMIIIAISTVTTTLTALSMSAISTNGEIKGGGIYYMISRSLGPAAGGSLGALFAFANSAMAALNIIGFSESLIALLATGDMKIIDGAQNDNRIISVVTMIVLQAIILIGMEWEAKAQMGLLVILLTAMADFMIGSFIGPKSDLELSKGFTGMNMTVLLNNMGPGYRFSEGQDQDFFTIFSIFFPAVAGIQAGASISGDLKDPGEAIPKGTLLAIFLTSASYALFAFLAGAGSLREANGIVTQVADWSFANCKGNSTCKWGLYNDYQVMQLMSYFGPLIYAGCFAATLSSALSCLVSGPKMFQALSKDKVYPYLSKFGVGYGKADDPYWSYALGFVVALTFILIADLNAVAPLISNFFMATYAVLNFCTFHASLVKPMGWRPKFRYYNTWLSLLGAIMCVIIMFLMSWVTALISFACVIALFATVIYRKPNLNWGSTTQAQTYSNALNALQSMAAQEYHVKNYRPQILCLSGFPSNRPALIEFSYQLTKNQSLLLCGQVIESKQPYRILRNLRQNGNTWLRDEKIRAFYVVVDNSSFHVGTQALLQSCGIGKMAPNVLLLGYKDNWQTCPKEEVYNYFTALHESLESGVGLSILRVKDGLDCSHLISADEKANHDASEDFDGHLHRVGSDTSLGYDNNSTLGDDLTQADDMPSPLDQGQGGEKPKKKKSSKKMANGGLGDEMDTKLTLFQGKQPKGYIDVWWLYDDGGLTLLLPYILTTRKNWSACKLRVFALANNRDQMEKELRGMASLLSKFRIDYSDLIVIPDVTKKAQPDTKALFNALIKPFKGDPDDSDTPHLVIGDAELFALKEKTNRHLRLRELLLEHSMKSNLIVMTLPVPRRGTVTAPLYMGWLETLTRDMPPFFLVRGNQTSVLTFYS